jgi:hypothetical protein
MQVLTGTEFVPVELYFQTLSIYVMPFVVI